MTIDAETRLFGVIGSPVAHSLGPVMHNRAFAHLGINAVYLAFEVTDIGAAVAGIRGLGLGGVSVTIPHKSAVMAHLDEVDDLARAVGAVNTVVHRDGRLTGHNTDCEGAMAALSEVTAVDGRSVAVLGAGGSARAVGFGIQAAGGRVTIFNRSRQRGEALADDLGVPFRPLSDFSGRDVDILVNTTAVGMVPESDAMPVAPETLAPHLVVMDIVYRPRRTRLLKAAAARGCRVVDGLAMFIGQGARQFERWTGRTAPEAVMEAAVLDALKETP